MKSISTAANFRTGGDFTVTSAMWDFQDAGKLAFEWTVYGADTLTAIALPELPTAMKSMFPTLSPDSLHFNRFELTRYPAFNSYNGYLEKIFQDNPPVRPGRFESSSVRIGMEK